MKFRQERERKKKNRGQKCLQKNVSNSALAKLLIHKLVTVKLFRHQNSFGRQNWNVDAKKSFKIIKIFFNLFSGKIDFCESSLQPRIRVSRIRKI